MSAEDKTFYPPVIPDIEDWPIYRLSEDRKNFVEEVDQFTVNRLLKIHGSKIGDTIAKTIYQERIRIKEEPWKVDPPNERLFWKRIRRKLLKSGLDKGEEEVRKTNEEILRQIVHRYSEEIVGSFRIKTFLFARRFLTLFFTRLLNTAAGRNWGRIFGSKYSLMDRLIVTGYIGEVRSLMKKGVVIVAPTHFSNLDSILIGYAMDTFMGLPSFSYGAGLNLYNTGYTAYFMNRLGAYRVDRRKKNVVYLETLKAMSNLSIQRGVNSLFFPGGTRSRSGALETKLKLGLLGTVVEAQRALFEQGKDTKVFVVPLVLGYHFVLEAKFLIEQHLRETGQERYIRSQDESGSPWQILKFIWQLFSKANEITLSFGRPMDVLGNPVDAEGRSMDARGRELDIKGFFMLDGVVNRDLQRESEYTKMVAEKIVDRYFRDNTVLTSHLVAYAAFEILKQQNMRLDIYGVLRLPEDDYVFPKDVLYDVIDQLKAGLTEMESRGEVRLSPEIGLNIEELVADGISRLGNFHVGKPLRFNKKDEIVSDSFKVLYYYHNRLENYGLNKKIRWRKMEEVPEPAE